MGLWQPLRRKADDHLDLAKVRRETVFVLVRVQLGLQTRALMPIKGVKSLVVIALRLIERDGLLVLRGWEHVAPIALQSGHQIRIQVVVRVLAVLKKFNDTVHHVFETLRRLIEMSVATFDGVLRPWDAALPGERRPSRKAFKRMFDVNHAHHQLENFGLARLGTNLLEFDGNCLTRVNILSGGPAVQKSEHECKNGIL
jgi:hypothetical protein